MSSGTKRPWAEAVALAQPLAEQLVPLCEPGRVKLAGSLRRRRAEVGDVEIVAQPRMVAPASAAQEGLFATEPAGESLLPDLEGVRSVIRSWGTLLKCGERFIQAALGDGTVVDVFLVHPPAQWGSILAIRTGPAELGQLAVTRLKDAGLRHVEGHVEDRAGAVIDTPDEETFFRLAGLPCLPPEQRDTPTARTPIKSPAAAGRTPVVRETARAEPRAVAPSRPVDPVGGVRVQRDRRPWTGDLRVLRDLLEEEAANSPSRRAWRPLEYGTLVAALCPEGERPSLRIARDRRTPGWDVDVGLIAARLGVARWDRGEEEGEGGAVAVRFTLPSSTVPCRGGCGGVGSLEKGTFVGFCSSCHTARQQQLPGWQPDKLVPRCCSKCGNPMDSAALLFGKEPLRCAQCLIKERRAPEGVGV